MTDCHFGISCEPNKESHCEHGKPIRFGCLTCAPTLSDLIININSQIESLREHKLRQIDENRKISRRVDQLEKLIKYNKYCHECGRKKELSGDEK